MEKKAKNLSQLINVYSIKTQVYSHPSDEKIIQYHFNSYNETIYKS